MQYGLSGGPIAAGLIPYADPINRACEDPAHSVPPAMAAGIAWRETIRGEVNGKWTAATVISADGGHGLFQLTSWYPDAWADPLTNANAACRVWLNPDLAYFHARFGLVGQALMRAVACSFNAGRGAVTVALLRGHDPDVCTTGGDYGSDVIQAYYHIIAGEKPH